MKMWPVVLVSAMVLSFQFESRLKAQEEGETPFEYTKRIHSELKEIKQLKPEEYFQRIDTYRTHLEKYIEHKKRVCEGEFSTIILAGGEKAERLPNPRRSSNKLTREERKLCFRELKALQITFINNMFLSRKKYLDYLHQDRIGQLQKARENAIKSLNRSFSRTRGSRRR